MLQSGAFHIALSHSQRSSTTQNPTIAFLLPWAHMTTRGDLAEKLFCTSTSLRKCCVRVHLPENTSITVEEVSCFVR